MPIGGASEGAAESAPAGYCKGSSAPCPDHDLSSQMPVVVPNPVPIDKPSLICTPDVLPTPHGVVSALQLLGLLLVAFACHGRGGILMFIALVFLEPFGAPM